jgi:predicted Zn-dependent protease
MNDVQRYRVNAQECLSAAERCEPAYRDLTISIAETWLALARHQDAMDGLLVIWSNASSDQTAWSY